MTIGPFTGSNSYLSNFYVAPVQWRGRTYRTNEHFYQAHKFDVMMYHLEVVAAPTAHEAKIAGWAHPAMPSWEQDKEHVMLTGLFLKFDNHPKLADLLFQTGDEDIVEYNTHHDNIWGSCTCSKRAGCQKEGSNKLGEALMRVRATFL